MRFAPARRARHRAAPYSRSAYLADREAGGRYSTLADHCGPKPLACADPAVFTGGLEDELEDDLFALVPDHKFGFTVEPAGELPGSAGDGAMPPSAAVDFVTGTSLLRRANSSSKLAMAASA